jgi:urea transporter
MTSGLHRAHEVVAWSLIGANAVVGAWCLVAHRWRVAGRRPVWIGVLVAQSITAVQAVIGVVLSRRAGVVLDDMHALYGFSAIIAIVIMYSYRTSPFMKGNELVLYGLGSWFVMGLGLRNVYLG